MDLRNCSGFEKVIISSYYVSARSDKLRYCIIDSDTGQILDNAQGDGYQTASQARTSWAYKNWKKRKKREKQNEINAWMTEHNDFCRDLTDYIVDVWIASHQSNARPFADNIKRSMPSDDELEQMLLEEDPQITFSAQDFKTVWRLKK